MLANFAALVLAAGRGTRFESETPEPFPKVLRPILGRPMVAYALDALRCAGITDITLVTGFMGDEVRSEIGDSVKYAFQPEQKGSGDAVACSAEGFRGFDGSLVVMCGDSPLFSSGSVVKLMREHVRARAAVTLATAILEEPFGYGRVVRDGDGNINSIVEEKCASDQERAIKEVNGGAYAFDASWLFANLYAMAQNAAGEYNLTDMVRVGACQGKKVAAVDCVASEILGVNTPAELRDVERIIRDRKRSR